MSEGSDSVFCCSVEEVEDQEGEKKKEQEQERDDGEDYQESAKHIKVIETDFKRPLRSSFRAKKGGEKRISGVLFEAQPQVVSQAEEPSKISVIESQDENDKSSQPDMLTEKDFVKLNFGLRSRIRRDSLDKKHTKPSADETSQEQEQA